MFFIDVKFCVATAIPNFKWPNIFEFAKFKSECICIRINHVKTYFILEAGYIRSLKNKNKKLLSTSVF